MKLPVFAALAALSLLLVSRGAAQQPALATAWTGYDTGTFSTAEWPWAARVADLDSDGDMDVATVNWWFYARLGVQRNDGTGRLAEATYSNYAKGGLDLVTGDFTGDGVTDVVVSNTGSNGEGNTVSLLRGLGGGAFAAQQQFVVGSGSFVGPVGLAAADFTSDGRPDVVVALYGYVGQGSQVALLVNDGHGGFLAAQPFAVGAGPYKLAAGDLDGDGHPDVAVVRAGQKLSILRGTGSGFAPAVGYDLLQWFNTDAYQSIELADMDRDGDLDVLCSSSATSVNFAAAVALLRNRGDGTFTPAEPWFTGAESTGAFDMAVGDVDGDAWPDLLGVVDARWMLMRGDGHGGLLAPELFGATENPMSIELADMDGDGDLDPVVVGRDSLETAVYHNPGDGSFATPEPVAAVPAGVLPAVTRGVDTADVDGDGDLDLAVPYEKVQFNGGGVAILRGDGAGDFAPPQVYATSLYPFYAKLVDLDGDQQPDLLWADDDPPYDVKTRRNVGHGNFGPLVNWTMGTCGNGEVGALDVDDDGDYDVALCEYAGCPGIPLSGRRVFIRRNNGDGTFQPPYVVLVSGFPERVRGADVDLDGHTDLLVTGNSWIDVCRGHSTGLFDAPVPAQADWAPKGFVVQDLDGDGLPDIASTNWGDVGSGGESVTFLRGHGDATFAAPLLLTGSYSHTDGNSRDIVAVDPDGDGDADLVAGNWASLDVSFFANRGAAASPQFAGQVRYGTGWNTIDLFGGDFTGDGLDDVAACVSFGGSLSFVPGVVLLRGTGGASPLADVGQGLAGALGTPRLLATGSLQGGSPETFALSGAAPGASFVRVVGTGLLGLPFKGGVMVPQPGLLVLLAADAQGKSLLQATWPAGLAPGLTVALQDWIVDGSGPHGFAASNALVGTTP